MAPPLLSPPLLPDSFATLPRSFRCSRPTRQLATVGFAGAVRSERQGSWSARRRGNLRIRATATEADYERPEEDVAEDFYSVLGVVCIFPNLGLPFSNYFGLFILIVEERISSLD
jgi:hypothetical protein